MRTEVRAPLCGVFFLGGRAGGDWIGGWWRARILLSLVDEGARFAVNQSKDAGGAGVVGSRCWSGVWMVKR